MGLLSGVDGTEYREEHRLKYATLLGRIVKARELSDEEREPHKALYQRLLRDAASERVKATSIWIDLSDEPVAWDDPRLKIADSSFGTVEQVAIDIVETCRAIRGAESPQELLEAMGAVEVSDAPKPAPTRHLCDHVYRRGVCEVCGINKKQVDYERTAR